MEVWKVHQFIIMAALTIWLVHHLWKADRIFALAAAFQLGQSLYTAHFNQLGRWQIPVSLGAFASFSGTMILLFFCLVVDAKNLMRALTALAAIVWIDSIVVMATGNGIFNTDSMDTTVMAMMLPMTLVFAWPFIFAPLAAIIFHGGTTAVATMLASSIGVAVVSSRWLAMFFLSLCLGASFYLQYTGVDLGTRPTEWMRFMRWWYESGDILFGVGAGSFQWLGPWIQETAGKSSDHYKMMHNDHLQLIFEYGIIGYSLMAAAYLRAMWFARNTHWLFGALLASAVAMGGYYPLHYLVSQMAVFCFLGVAYHKNHEACDQVRSKPDTEYSPHRSSSMNIRMPESASRLSH